MWLEPLVKPKVYLETTVPSYLTAWPSREVVVAAHQHTTRQWWETRRHDFELFASQFVIDEASLGDPEAATRRLGILTELLLLEPSNSVYELAEELVKRVPLPVNAVADSLHIAIATVNGMDYLLTWNCAHIANAELRARIETVCRNAGYDPPVICTPEELLEE
jgi:hypothetical protein